MYDSLPESETTLESAVHWPSRVIAAMLCIWMTGVTVTVQGTVWFSQQLSTRDAGGGLSDPDFIATVVQGLLLLLPLTPVAFLWKKSRYRTIFRLWFLAALFALLSAVIHLPGAVQAYTSVTLQIIVALAFAVAVAILDRRSPLPAAESSHDRRVSLPLALSIPPLLLLPWADVGAPGTPLEAVLNLIAALLFGLCAGLLLRRLARPEVSGPVLDIRMRVWAGFVAGAALAPMAGAYGFGGTQLLLLLSVPATAWIATALLSRYHDGRALAILIGICAAGPLLFIDPREMAISVSFGLFSTLSAAFRAALFTLTLAWLLGAVLLAWRWLGRGSLADTEDPHRPGSWSRLLLAIPSWLALILAIVFLGQPEFYGDRLFVVLRDQADVSAAATMDDVAERRRYVYETLVGHAQTSQGSLRQELAQWGFDFTPYYLVNGLEVEGGPLLRLWLQSRPEVDRVLYSPILRPAPPESAGLANGQEPSSPPWNLSFIGADAVWEVFSARGAGIVVGQSDSGVQWDHPQLADAYRGGPGEHDYNWFDPWYHSQEPVDTGGHGTHTLATVLGNSTGVAPDSTWYGCANLSRNVGSTAYYLDCMQFMLAPFPLSGDPFTDGDPALGANVLNNSWGCPDLEGCDATSLLPAVVALRNAGTFVVVSAGNEGPACSSLESPPAIYEQVLSVGAVDRFRNVTDFSSRGPVTFDGSNRTKPNIMAPGLDILSAFPGNRYHLWQGTSMAGPHVAGVVALMWSANPQLIGDVARTEQILLETAQPPENAATPCSGDQTLPNNTFGYGIVDAYAAVEQAMLLASN